MGDCAMNSAEVSIIILLCTNCVLSGVFWGKLVQTANSHEKRLDAAERNIDDHTKRISHIEGTMERRTGSHGDN